MTTNIENLVNELSKLSILEASELIKSLEEKWGVKAASLNSNNSVQSSDGNLPAAEAVEKTEFDVELTTVGDKKIQIIKIVREITGLGLKEAKDLVDSAPKIIKSAISKADADVIKLKLETEGASVVIK